MGPFGLSDISLCNGTQPRRTPASAAYPTTTPSSVHATHAHALITTSGLFWGIEWQAEASSTPNSGTEALGMDNKQDR
jgi:hypothetical protein